MSQETESCRIDINLHIEQAPVNLISNCWKKIVQMGKLIGELIKCIDAIRVVRFVLRSASKRQAPFCIFLVPRGPKANEGLARLLGNAQHQVPVESALSPS